MSSFTFALYQLCDIIWKKVLLIVYLCHKIIGELYSNLYNIPNMVAVSY